MRNNCIRFCLKLDKMHHIPEEEFKLINSSPTSKSVDQFITTMTYNFVNNTFLDYLNEIFEFSPHFRICTGNNFSKLKNPFCKRFGICFLNISNEFTVDNTKKILNKRVCDFSTDYDSIDTDDGSDIHKYLMEKNYI